MDRESVIAAFTAAIRFQGGFKTLVEIDPMLDHIYGYAMPAVFIKSEDSEHSVEFPENFDLNLKIMVVAHRLNDPEGKKSALFINRYLDDLVVLLKKVVYSPRNHLLPQVTRTEGNKPVFPGDPTMRVGFVYVTAPMYVDS